MDKVERHLNTRKTLAAWLGIRVYKPERNETGEVVWHLQQNAPVKVQNVLTIGVLKGRAFLIKNIERLVRIYTCPHCHTRFTKASHLQRHILICPEGETRIFCPNNKIEAAKTAFELAFFPDKTHGVGVVNWIESESRRRGIHIHHEGCGHGGERWIEDATVDGFHAASKTVFQFHGCFFHGCRKCYPDRSEKLAEKKTAEQLFRQTVDRTNKLRIAGFRVITKWECDFREPRQKPKTFTKPLPHAILFDLESFGDRN